MTTILLAGQSVLDFIFEVDELPTRPEKYRAHAGQIIGGGCASNAAVAVRRLGGEAWLASRVGSDPVAKTIADGLAAEGVNIDNLFRAEGGNSSYSAISVDRHGDRQIVNLRGDGLGDPLDWSLPRRIDGVLADTRWESGAIQALRLARDRGVPGVLDGESPIPEELARLASHVVFSLQGIAHFTGDSAVGAALSVAKHKLPDSWVAVTDGANGTYHRANGAVVHTPAFHVAVVDTLGAGDVFHGAFVLALAEGMAEAEAVRFASATAALKCTRHGGRAGTPHRSEVEELLRNGKTAAAE
jgi:sulfofructose kinase